MHLSSGHVTFMPGKFYPPLNFHQSDLGRRADSRWALPQIFSWFMYSLSFWLWLLPRYLLFYVEL